MIKLPPEKLEHLRSLANDIALLDLKFKLEVGQALIELKQSISTTALCLVCGTPFPIGQNCPICEK